MMLAAITQGLSSSLPEAAVKCAGMKGSEFLWDPPDCRLQKEPSSSPHPCTHKLLCHFTLDGGKTSNTGEIISVISLEKIFDFANNPVDVTGKKKMLLNYVRFPTGAGLRGT